MPSRNLTDVTLVSEDHDGPDDYDVAMFQLKHTSHRIRIEFVKLFEMCICGENISVVLCPQCFLENY